ncbi:biotin--[acetyl-CoA-carboxylase] ligase [Bifidobacterium sp. 64T4]|nr:biotin--[acetyl-CoA-carboxylase] ligase [Bifidobacterium pongonis]
MPRTERAASRVIAYRSIDSTNSEARRLLLNGDLRPGCDEIAVIAADVQIAGRGRLDHAWVSRPGESFIVTFVASVPRSLATDASINGWLQMTAGLAAVDGLREAMGECGATPIAHGIGQDTDSGFMLKWPNDVFLDGRKLGGILSEMAPLQQGGGSGERDGDPDRDPSPDRIAIIFGIGLNLAIPAEHLPTSQSTSLQLHYAPLPAPETLRDIIAAHIAASLGARLRHLETDRVREAGRAHDETARICYTLGRHAVAHFVDGTEMEGEAVALNADASLDLRTQDGAIHTIRTADVGVLPEPCV